MPDDQDSPEGLTHASAGQRPTSDDQRRTHRRRDSEVLTIIGCFFALLAAMVLVGVVWNSPDEGMAVGVGAGVLLLLIGLGAVVIGMRLRRGPT